MTLEGVDISSAQGDYQFHTNPDFAIIKATGGHSYRNEYLDTQVANARARNIVVHFYHYMFEPTTGGGDPHLEAQNFIAACRPYVQPGSIFWLDVEEFPARVGYTGNLADWIVAWCDEVERAFGCVPGIYCATWYLTATGLDQETRLARYPFWMASWQEDIPPAHFMAPWDELTIHQYDTSSRKIDQDRFYGTRDELLALGIPPAAPLPDTTEPITASSYINEQGQPETKIIWGGQASTVLGTDYQDIGIRVQNAAGQIYHRSIKANQGQQYVEE